MAGDDEILYVRVRHFGKLRGRRDRLRAWNSAQLALAGTHTAMYTHVGAGTHYAALRVRGWGAITVRVPGGAVGLINDTTVTPTSVHRQTVNLTGSRGRLGFEPFGAELTPETVGVERASIWRRAGRV